MSDLKPCPFCGKPYKYAEGDPLHVHCSNMGYGLPCGNQAFYSVECWNTRPIEDALQQQVSTLTEQLAEAMKIVERVDLRDLDESEGALAFGVSEVERLNKQLASVTAERDRYSEVIDRLTSLFSDGNMDELDDYLQDLANPPEAAK